MSKKSWPILYSNLLYRMVQHFFDRQYIIRTHWSGEGGKGLAFAGLNKLEKEQHKSKAKTRVKIKLFVVIYLYYHYISYYY